MFSLTTLKNRVRKTRESIFIVLSLFLCSFVAPKSYALQVKDALGQKCEQLLDRIDKATQLWASNQGVQLEIEIRSLEQILGFVRTQTEQSLQGQGASPTELLTDANHIENYFEVAQKLLFLQIVTHPKDHSDQWIKWSIENGLSLSNPDLRVLDLLNMPRAGGRSNRPSKIFQIVSQGGNHWFASLSESFVKGLWLSAIPLPSHSGLIPPAEFQQKQLEIAKYFLSRQLLQNLVSLNALRERPETAQALFKKLPTVKYSLFTPSFLNEIAFLTDEVRTREALTRSVYSTPLVFPPLLNDQGLAQLVGQLEKKYPKNKSVLRSEAFTSFLKKADQEAWRSEWSKLSGSSLFLGADLVRANSEKFKNQVPLLAFEAKSLAIENALRQLLETWHQEQTLIYQEEDLDFLAGLLESWKKSYVQKVSPSLAQSIYSIATQELKKSGNEFKQRLFLGKLIDASQAIERENTLYLEKEEIQLGSLLRAVLAKNRFSTPPPRSPVARDLMQKLIENSTYAGAKEAYWRWLGEWFNDPVIDQKTLKSVPEPALQYWLTSGRIKIQWSSTTSSALMQDAWKKSVKDSLAFALELGRVLGFHRELTSPVLISHLNLNDKIRAEYAREIREESRNQIPLLSEKVSVRDWIAGKTEAPLSLALYQLGPAAVSSATQRKQATLWTEEALAQVERSILDSFKQVQEIRDAAKFWPIVQKSSLLQYTLQLFPEIQLEGSGSLGKIGQRTSLRQIYEHYSKIYLIGGFSLLGLVDIGGWIFKKRLGPFAQIIHAEFHHLIEGYLIGAAALSLSNTALRAKDLLEVNSKRRMLLGLKNSSFLDPTSEQEQSDLGMIASLSSASEAKSETFWLAGEVVGYAVLDTISLYVPLAKPIYNNVKGICIPPGELWKDYLALKELGLKGAMGASSKALTTEELKRSFFTQYRAAQSITDPVARAQKVESLVLSHQRILDKVLARTLSKEGVR